MLTNTDLILSNNPGSIKSTGTPDFLKNEQNRATASLELIPERKKGKNIVHS